MKDIRRTTEPMPVSRSPDPELPTTLFVLAPSRRREGRVDIAAGGTVVATLGVEAVVRLGLHDGAPAEAELLEAIGHEARALATFDRAANMLAAKARASRELRLALLRKGEPDEQVDAAIARLRELGHLDDARFARQFVRSRVLGAGFSRRRVQAELVRRGISRADANAAIEEVLTEEAVDESEMLAATARKRLRLLAAHDPATRRRRLFGFLLRRGFDSGDIARSIDKLLEESDPPG